MPINPYGLCPGGTGKKVKFCCRDLMGELDKIQLILDGDQTQAALDYVEQLDRRFPGRACLLGTKATLEQVLNRSGDAERTVDQLLASHPNNPVGLAFRAILEAMRGNVQTAIQLVHAAMIGRDTPLPGVVYRALRSIVIVLAETGYMVSALAHATLHLQLRPEDEEALSTYLSLFGSGAIPLALKNVGDGFEACPEGAVWKARFDAARSAANRARWAEAERRYTELAAEVNDVPAIWRNLARLRGYLADHPGAVAAWRRASALPIPLREAVDAELMAQLLDSVPVSPLIDVLEVSYPVSDSDALIARLGTESYVRAVSFEWNDRDTPPPRAAFHLLDRPMPTTGANVSEPEIANAIGSFLVFGRRTDQGPVLELHIERDQLAAAGLRLTAITGGLLGEPGGERVIEKTNSIRRAFTFRGVLPPDLPIERAKEIIQEHQLRAISEFLPTIALPLFGGRSLEQAAANPEDQIRVLAYVHFLESTATMRSLARGFERLRDRLGLPRDPMVSPRETPLEALPLTRWKNLKIDELSDEELERAWRRANVCHAVAAVRPLSEAVLSRPGLADGVPATEVFAALVKLEDEEAEALEFIARGREADRQAGNSTAVWDLLELPWRLRGGNGAEASRLIKQIERDHSRNADIMGQLAQILFEAGIIDENGRPIARPTQTRPAETRAPESRIWTPGQSESPDTHLPGAQPAAEAATGAASRRPAIWTPYGE